MGEIERLITELRRDYLHGVWMVHMKPAEEGPYILYTDHATRIAELEAKLAKAEGRSAELERNWLTACDELISQGKRAERAEAEAAGLRERKFTPEMAREALVHMPFSVREGEERWEWLANYINTALEQPDVPCPCCGVTPRGKELGDG